MPQFQYDRAFSRTIGWLTAEEFKTLPQKKVAIAGLGGVGGSHLLTLTRLGITQFNLADFDSFELENFNRQAGAFISSIGQPKLEVLKTIASDINPELKLNCFDDGIKEGNITEFLTGCDVYVDGLDFFAIEIRRKLFKEAYRMGIPAVTCAPLGMGAALLVFLPGKMDFDTYFKLENKSESEQLLNFLLGLSPKRIQSKYLMDSNRIDLENHKGPSTPMACELCAGITATQVLKILLGRGKVYSAPHGLVFDAYENKLTHTWRPFGSNPIIQFFQKMKPNQGNKL